MLTADLHLLLRLRMSTRPIYLHDVGMDNFTFIMVHYLASILRIREALASKSWLDTRRSAAIVYTVCRCKKQFRGIASISAVASFYILTNHKFTTYPTFHAVSNTHSVVKQVTWLHVQPRASPRGNCDRWSSNKTTSTSFPSRIFTESIRHIHLYFWDVRGNEWCEMGLWERHWWRLKIRNVRNYLPVARRTTPQESKRSESRIPHITVQEPWTDTNSPISQLVIWSDISLGSV